MKAALLFLGLCSAFLGTVLARVTLGDRNTRGSSGGPPGLPLLPGPPGAGFCIFTRKWVTSVRLGHVDCRFTSPFYIVTFCQRQQCDTDPVRYCRDHWVTSRKSCRFHRRHKDYVESLLGTQARCIFIFCRVTLEAYFSHRCSCR